MTKFLNRGCSNLNAVPRGFTACLNRIANFIAMMMAGSCWHDGDYVLVVILPIQQPLWVPCGRSESLNWRYVSRWIQSAGVNSADLRALGRLGRGIVSGKASTTLVDAMGLLTQGDRNQQQSNMLVELAYQCFWMMPDSSGDTPPFVRRSENRKVVTARRVGHIRTSSTDRGRWYSNVLALVSTIEMTHSVDQRGFV